MSTEVSGAEKAEYKRLYQAWIDLGDRHIAFRTLFLEDEKPETCRKMMAEMACVYCYDEFVAMKASALGRGAVEWTSSALALLRDVQKRFGRPASSGWAVCDRHSGPGECLVFLAPKAVFGAGHVAWAYRIPKRASERVDGRPYYWYGRPGPWFVGSVDNSDKGSVVSPPGRTGYWQDEAVTDPLEVIRPLEGYPVYKRLRLGQGQAGLAYLASYEVKQWPYKVIGQNCADAARHVLEAYGANLPDLNAVTTARPVDWFNAIPGKALSV